MPVPYTFGTATTSIPLSNLDANFNTPVTIGNATVGLGNTVTTVGNLTLTNATISSGNVTVTTGIFGAGSNTAPAITTTGDTNTGIFFPAADTIAFAEGGAEVARIDSSGQLGIGTTSPTVPLQIYNATNAAALIQGDAGANITIQRYSTNATQPSLILFKARGTLASPTAVATGDQIGSVVFQAYGGTNTRSIAGIRAYAETYTSDTDISSYLWFGTTPAGTTTIAERMRIDSSGNVGIGTSSPASLLQVGSTASSNTALTVVSANNTAAQINLLGDSSATVGINVKYEGNGNFFAISSTSSGTLTERMRIDSSGNLLVGLTSALGNGLSVSSAGNTIYARCTASSQSVNVMWNSGNNTGTSADLVQLGVGTSSFTSVGTISYNGTLTVYSTTSDQRLKENIVNSQSGLKKLANVKIRAFDWKEHGNHTDFGVIAQELYEVAPEAVVKGDEDAEITKTWKVDTAILVPAMIKAIQEQQVLIENLTTRLNALEGN